MVRLAARQDASLRMDDHPDDRPDQPARPLRHLLREPVRRSAETVVEPIDRDSSRGCIIAPMTGMKRPLTVRLMAGVVCATGLCGAAMAAAPPEPGAGAPAAQTSTSAQACGQLTSLKLPDIRITDAVVVPAAGLSYCARLKNAICHPVVAPVATIGAGRVQEKTGVRWPSIRFYKRGRPALPWRNRWSLLHDDDGQRQTD